jgi:hypothetical protein
MSNLPTGTLTMFHTDIENSTLLTRDLREQYPAVLAAHRTLLRAAFTAHEGWEVDTQGDGFFVVFPRATQAVAAAVQIQRTLAVEPWPEGRAVRVRIGMHTGEPIRTLEGYTGLDVIGFGIHHLPLIARLECILHGVDDLITIGQVRRVLSHRMLLSYRSASPKIFVLGPLHAAAMYSTR